MDIATRPKIAKAREDVFECLVDELKSRGVDGPDIVNICATISEKIENYVAEVIQYVSIHSTSKVVDLVDRILGHDAVAKIVDTLREDGVNG